MKVVCKYNDPLNLPNNISDDFDFGLIIEKEYLVMGILTYKKSNSLYYLIDENGRPSWFPFQIFEISNNVIPEIWFLKINIDNEYVDYFNLMGFNELCNNDGFFNKLLERDEKTMQTYFRRKIELENESAE